MQKVQKCFLLMDQKKKKKDQAAKTKKEGRSNFYLFLVRPVDGNRSKIGFEAKAEKDL